jgi:hypothetical protein
VSPDPVLALVLRPARFFPARADRLGAPACAAVAWAVGAAIAASRLDALSALADLGVTGSGPIASLFARGEGAALHPSGALGWGLVAGAGLLAGALQWWIGGFWYWLRLRLCGDPAPAARRARRLNGLADLVWALPTLAVAAAGMLVHPRPDASVLSGPVVLSPVVLVFWSLFVSYRGALASFSLRPGRARLWFAVLPASFLALAVLGSLAIGGAAGLGLLH